jgi:hypothetical protein
MKSTGYSGIGNAKLAIDGRSGNEYQTNTNNNMTKQDLL